MHPDPGVARTLFFLTIYEIFGLSLRDCGVFVGLLANKNGLFALRKITKLKVWDSKYGYCENLNFI